MLYEVITIAPARQARLDYGLDQAEAVRVRLVHAVRALGGVAQENHVIALGRIGPKIPVRAVPGIAKEPRASSRATESDTTPSARNFSTLSSMLIAESTSHCMVRSKLSRKVVSRRADWVLTIVSYEFQKIPMSDTAKTTAKPIDKEETFVAMLFM